MILKKGTQVRIQDNWSRLNGETWLLDEDIETEGDPRVILFQSPNTFTVKNISDLVVIEEAK